MVHGVLLASVALAPVDRSDGFHGARMVSVTAVGNHPGAERPWHRGRLRVPACRLPSGSMPSAWIATSKCVLGSPADDGNRSHGDGFASGLQIHLAAVIYVLKLLHDSVLLPASSRLTETITAWSTVNREHPWRLPANREDYRVEGTPPWRRPRRNARRCTAS